MPEQVKNKPEKNKLSTSKRNFWITKSLLGLSLVLLILGFARVPYIGQLIDGLFFSFLFGYAKYILYLYLFIIIIYKLFNLNPKLWFNKRTIVFVSGLIIVTCVFLGGLQIAVFPREDNLLNFYINDIWLGVMFKFSDQFVFGTNFFIDGGIIGVLIATISGVFIILFALFAAVCLYFFIFRNHWYLLKNKLLFKNVKKLDADQQSKLVSSINLSAARTTNSAYLNTLMSTINNDAFNLDDTLKANTVDLEQQKQILLNFFTENKLVVADLQTSETEQKYLITIKAENDVYTKIESLKDYINLIGLASDYQLVFSEENIVIEYPKFQRLLNLNLVKLLTAKVFNPLDYTCFLDVHNQPVMLNLQTDYFIGISSNNNRDIENFINDLIASVSNKYGAKYLDISIVSPTNKNFATLATKNTLPVNVVDVQSLDSFLDKIQIQIENIAEKIKETKVVDIYELNNILKAPLKNHVIIIDQLDLLKSNSILIYNKICGLQKFATLCGFTFICIDRSKTGVSFDEINYTNIVVFNYDSYLAKKILDKHYKSGLGDKNMSFIYAPNKKVKIEKIFIPQMNDIELKILAEKLQ